MTNSTLAGPFIDQWRWQSSFPPRPSPEMFHQQPALISRKRRAYSAEGVAACKQSKSSWQADQSPSLYGWNWTFTADAYARAIPPGLRCLTFFLILRKGETEPHCYHGLLTATLIGRGESRVALFHKQRRGNLWKWHLCLESGEYLFLPLCFLFSIKYLISRQRLSASLFCEEESTLLSLCIHSTKPHWLWTIYIPSIPWRPKT